MQLNLGTNRGILRYKCKLRRPARSVGPFSVSSHSSEDLFDDTEFENRSSIIRNENYEEPVNYGSTENT